MGNSKVCLKCHAYIPDDSIYCPSCGTYMFEGKPRLEYIARDIQTIGEKKFITVIFVLIESRETLSHTEDIFKKRKEILSKIGEIAKGFGAWVDKWLGLKGIMLIFGIPRVTRMDPELACRLAIEIESYLKKQEDIVYKIGINSGWVYFGKVGSSTYLHKTVIGDTVNTAFRLAETANSEIIISEETNSLIEEKFYTVKKKKIFLKGRENVISIYQLKDIRGEPKKIRFRIPFVGRREELELLNSYANLAEKRKGGVLFIKGPAGIGKTTLKNYWLKTFKQLNKFFIIETEPFFEIHSFPLGIFVRGIEKFAKKEENYSLIKDLREYKELNNFFSSKKEEIDPLSYVELSKFVLRKFFEALLSIKPVIFIVDSIEKLDETTKIVLEYLLVSLQDRTFFLLLGRENFLPIEFAFVKEKNLHPFTFKEIEQILKSFFKEEPDINFIRKFQEITEGIPLYVTEFLKVTSSKKSTKLEIPSSLIGTILEFYDILTPEEKTVLEKMSILIEWDENGPLKEIFNEREKEIIKNFVEDEIMEKESDVYKFINPLVRNVIYNAVLKSRKIEIHSKVVEILDHKVDIKTLSPYLFYHSYNGEIWEKAFHFALISGKERLASGSFKEAIDYFNKAEECFNKIKGEDITRLSEVFECKAEAERRMGLIEEAIKDLHRSIVIMEGVKDKKLFSLKQKLGEIYLEKNEIYSSKKILMELMEHRGELEEESLISTHITLGEVYFHMGQYHLSLSEYHKAYNLMRMTKRKKTYEIALGLAKLHIEIGNFELAKDYIEIAEENVKEYKDILWEFKIKENKFNLFIRTGNFQKIVKEVKEAIMTAKFLENEYYYFLFTTVEALLNAYMRNKNVAKKTISESLKMSKKFLNAYNALSNMAKAMYLVEEKEYLLSFLKNLYKMQENFPKLNLIELNLLLAKITENEPQKFVEKAFEISKNLTSPYIHLLVFKSFVEVYKKTHQKDKMLFYLRKANYLLKEIANKFKDQNLRNIFIMHPDFEILRSVSFFTF